MALGISDILIFCEGGWDFSSVRRGMPRLQTQISIPTDCAGSSTLYHQSSTGVRLLILNHFNAKHPKRKYTPQRKSTDTLMTSWVSHAKSKLGHEAGARAHNNN